MPEACSPEGRKEMHTKFKRGGANLKERDHLAYVDMGGRIINWIFKIKDYGRWTDA
jgi:hypothetical protein